LTGEHWPGLAPRLHAWQGPEQVCAQHTLSTQVPCAHSAVVMHEAPFDFLCVQMLAELQNWSAAHGLLALHPPEQASAAHWWLGHWTWSPVPQAPAPSHVAASVTVPPVHDCATHVTPVPGIAHVAGLLPSQAAAQGGWVPAQAVRGRRGAPLTAMHIPFFPLSAQASHWRSQAPSQQTESTQYVDVQSAPVVQGSPFERFVAVSGPPPESGRVSRGPSAGGAPPWPPWPLRLPWPPWPPPASYGPSSRRGSLQPATRASCDRSNARATPAPRGGVTKRKSLTSQRWSRTGGRC
jgi:hypothetical protein